MNAQTPITPRRSGRTEDARAARRLKVFLPTEVVIDDAAIRAHILDISANGSLLHTGTEPESGSDVVLRLNGNALSAKIVWVGAGRLGLQFSTELSVDQIESIIVPKSTNG